MPCCSARSPAIVPATPTSISPASPTAIAATVASSRPRPVHARRSAHSTPTPIPVMCEPSPCARRARSDAGGSAASCCALRRRSSSTSAGRGHGRCRGRAIHNRHTTRCVRLPGIATTGSPRLPVDRRLLRSNPSATTARSPTGLDPNGPSAVPARRATCHERQRRVLRPESPSDRPEDPVEMFAEHDDIVEVRRPLLIDLNAQPGGLGPPQDITIRGEVVAAVRRSAVDGVGEIQHDVVGAEVERAGRGLIDERQHTSSAPFTGNKAVSYHPRLPRTCRSEIIRIRG